jgi:short-subunit dehydrogenase
LGTQNKTIIITGASRGIGRSVSMLFARLGANLVICSRSKSALANVSKDLDKLGANYLAISADVGDAKSVDNLFKAAKKKFGRIDIVVNNAGSGLRARCDQTEDEAFDQLVKVNLYGVFYVTSRALKIFNDNKKSDKNTGVIVTVCSMASFFSMPKYSVYCAVKHAVKSFKRSVRKEVSSRGIKIKMVYPFRVNTAFFDDYALKPSKRQLLEPKDIAQVIVSQAMGWHFRTIYYYLRNFFKRIYRLIFG